MHNIIVYNCRYTLIQSKNLFFVCAQFDFSQKHNFKVNSDKFEV